MYLLTPHGYPRSVLTMKKLTQLSIDKKKPHPTKRLEIADAGKPGLYLVVQPTGAKSWAVRYRRPSDGKPRKLTLDGFPSLALAHKLTQKALDRVAEGFDPAAEKMVARESRGSDLFKDIATRFLEHPVTAKKKRPWRASYAYETKRMLDKEVLPLWGNRRIQDITKRDVQDLLESIIRRGGGLTANRVLAAVRRLFNWAIEKSILTTTPVVGVEAPLPEKARDRILSDDEVRWLWLACDQLGYPFGAMAKLLLLTGQRRNEVAGMTWGELDLDKALWTIPGSRAKNSEKHEVPLSDAALLVIASLPWIKSDKGFLFTTNATTHVSGYSRAKAAIDKAMLAIARESDPEVQIPGWGLHDLRRSAASGMAKLGIALPVTEKVLNHRSGSFAGIVGVYQRHDFAEEKRTALQAWANQVLATVEKQPANVVRMPPRRA
jgi:integrase